MDYNFKRIADVEEIESVSEDTMFLVNDGGVIKQTHAQMQSDGDGSSLNPILANAKATGGIGWTEQGVQTTIEWDGDITGKVSVADSYYKVEDYTAVTKTDLIGCIVDLQNSDEFPAPIVIEADEINDELVNHAIVVGDYAVFVSEPTSYGTFNFAESGIYFANYGDAYTSSLTYSTPDTVHKIDSKYVDGSGGESKNFYILEFDGTDNMYLVKNLTTGEIDEDYGGAVSQQLYEEYQQDPFDVMSRVVTMLGPAGGICAYYKPIGVSPAVDGTKFVFYAHGSMPMNTYATCRPTEGRYCWY